MTNQFAATQRVRRKRALEAAGYTYLAGWVRFGPVAEIAQAEIENSRPEVKRIADAAERRG